MLRLKFHVCERRDRRQERDIAIGSREMHNVLYEEHRRACDESNYGRSVHEWKFEIYDFVLKFEIIWQI